MCDRTEPAQIPDNLLKVVLHVWFTVPYRPNTLDNAFQYLTQLVEERPIYRSGAYIREVIVENIGADAFVLRLLEDTKREDASDRYFGAILRALLVFGLTSQLKPHFIKHTCLDVLMPTLSARCVPGGDKYRALLYHQALDLF